MPASHGLVPSTIAALCDGVGGRAGALQAACDSFDVGAACIVATSGSIGLMDLVACSVMRSAARPCSSAVWRLLTPG